MTKTKVQPSDKIGQLIEKLVNKYPWSDSKELFRTELEYLVAVAEREQMKKDHENTMKILRKK